MAKQKKVDLIKQRERRAKIAAGVGFLLFLVIAAIEIPPVLKQGGNTAPASSSSASSSTSTPAPSTGDAAPTTTTRSGELADTDVPPSEGAGELVSFSVFQAKNPFAPQVPSAPAGATSSSSTAPSSGTTADKGGADVPGSTTTTTPTSTTPTTTTPTTTTPTGVVPPTSTTPVTAAPPEVTIKVNGVAGKVAVEGTFPASGPVFRLVSFTATTADIGIVGGSYSDGGATLTLHVGQPVTLENQTAGKRYTVELVSTP